jgi:hypothetical protein
MAFGHGEIPDELSIIMTCREMKWDYWTYLKQPTWFISNLRIMRRVEYEENKLRETSNKSNGTN